MFTKFEKVGIPLDNVRRKAFNAFNLAVYQKEILLNQVNECFCGSRDFENLSTLERFGLPFGTQICKKCGLVTQKIRIDDNSMPQFYDEIYWPLVLGEKKSFNTPPKENESEPYVLKFIKDSNKNLKVFEVGCGSGNRIQNISDHLEKKGHKVEKYGADYSKDALEVCEAKGIKTVNGGIDEIQEFGKPDILVLSHVVEHFTDLRVELKKIRELVSEETLIYVEVPGILDLENKPEYNYDYQMYNVLAHTYNFNLQTLTNVFNSLGFELLSGDEFVRSVFVLQSDIQENFQHKSSYEETINSLQRSYMKRNRIIQKRSYIFINYLKSIIKSILRKT